MMLQRRPRSTLFSSTRIKLIKLTTEKRLQKISCNTEIWTSNLQPRPFSTVILYIVLLLTKEAAVRKICLDEENSVAVCLKTNFQVQQDIAKNPPTSIHDKKGLVKKRILDFWKKSSREPLLFNGVTFKLEIILWSRQIRSSFWLAFWILVWSGDW